MDMQWKKKNCFYPFLSIYVSTCNSTTTAGDFKLLFSVLVPWPTTWCNLTYIILIRAKFGWLESWSIYWLINLRRSLIQPTHLRYDSPRTQEIPWNIILTRKGQPMAHKLWYYKMCISSNKQDNACESVCWLQEPSIVNNSVEPFQVKVKPEAEHRGNRAN